VTAVELLDRLRSLGVRLWIEGERIEWRAHRGVMTVELLAETKAHRDEVYVLLSREPRACARCGATDVRLIATYWTAWREALCPDCVQQLVAWFDRTGWPPVPPEWLEGESPGRQEVR
jgi:hypothetical protein